MTNPQPPANSQRQMTQHQTNEQQYQHQNTQLRQNTQQYLPQTESWQPSAHAFDNDQYLALEAAIGANRPLLVRGEPGLGKSQIARAVAAAWQWRLITAVIHSRTELEDLLYRMDHVGRLSDAHQGQGCGSLKDYVRPGPVWKAMRSDYWQREVGWAGAESGAVSEEPADLEGIPTGNNAYKVEPSAGCVLLIDEIDKAHRDVPNALLEVLNSGKFKVSETGETIESSHGLFIVITANDERPLPAAFLRRCAVLDLSLGKDPADKLQNIAQAHLDMELLSKTIEPCIEPVIDYIVAYRNEVPDGNYRPGTSEMLDMLRVLDKRGGIDEGKDNELANTIEAMGRFLVQKEFLRDSEPG